jgi:hypothetical protein
VSNSAYAKVNHPIVADQQGYGNKDHTERSGPVSIELGGSRTWSEIDASAHLVIYGGTITTSQPEESPGGAFQNPGPSKLIIRPGWNSFTAIRRRPIPGSVRENSPVASATRPPAAARASLCAAEGLFPSAASSAPWGYPMSEPRLSASPPHLDRFDLPGYAGARQ